MSKSVFRESKSLLFRSVLLVIDTEFAGDERPCLGCLITAKSHNYTANKMEINVPGARGLLERAASASGSDSESGKFNFSIRNVNLKIREM